MSLCFVVNPTAIMVVISNKDMAHMDIFGVFVTIYYSLPCNRRSVSLF
jgi:hypothetical protein